MWQLLNSRSLDIQEEWIFKYFGQQNKRIAVTAASRDFTTQTAVKDSCTNTSNKIALMWALFNFSAYRKNNYLNNSVFTSIMI